MGSYIDIYFVNFIFKLFLSKCVCMCTDDKFKDKPGLHFYSVVDDFY